MKSKVFFSVMYLRHRIDQHSVHLLRENVRAVQDAPGPSNVKSLSWSFDQLQQVPSEHGDTVGSAI